MPHPERYKEDGVLEVEMARDSRILSFQPLVVLLEPQLTLGLLRVTMLSLSLVTLGLATIGAYAKPTIRAAGGLEISLSTPAEKVASVSDLRVIATVKNVGDEDLKILRFGTVLDNKLPTRSFIVKKGGKEAAFTGVKVRTHQPPPAPIFQPSHANGVP